MLAVYDPLLTDEERRRLMSHDFGVQIGTYRQLKAVCLIHPLRWTDAFEGERHEEEMWTDGRHSLPDREGESFIVWRNMMEPKSADGAISCIADFPSNLARLYAT